MQKFALIGSGRVPSHLAPAIVHGGIACTGVWSRTYAHAEALARKLDTAATAGLGDFIRRASDSGAEALLISVTDDAIPIIASALPRDLDIPAVHTSGSSPLEVLAPLPNRGVLYPMQTFSGEREIEVSEVPFFLEYNTDKAGDALKAFTEAIGAKNVRTITSEERVRLHLAAVFGCNFVNHLYALASKTLEGTSIPFSSLAPLLSETLAKALSFDPKTVQTGPAVRRDSLTIERHLTLLRKEAPSLAEVYDLLTRSIQNLS